MAVNERSAHYRRQGSIGVIALQGIVDIFEAGTVHEASLKALHDAKATTIRMDLAQVERLDVSNVQILAALRQAVEASGRQIHAEGARESVLAGLSQIGCKL